MRFIKWFVVLFVCALVFSISFALTKSTIPGSSQSIGNGVSKAGAVHVQKRKEKIKAETEQCRAHPLAGVYHPSRLSVVESCKTVSGIVARVRHEQDGDYHINLKLDPLNKRLINTMNKKYENGDLVVEVIPMDARKIPLPFIGEHIKVTGAYVKDDWHKWMEIHPAWIINGKGSVHYTDAEARKSVIQGVCGRGDFDCPKQSKWEWIKNHLF